MLFNSVDADAYQEKESEPFKSSINSSIETYNPVYHQKRKSIVLNSETVQMTWERLGY